MKKAIFIIPYFGKLPYYFLLWEKTAGYNKEFTFWILTDDKTVVTHYENVVITQLSFEQFVQKAQKVFDFPVGLTTPRKLCDFKPTYGYIFEDEIKDYQYWGYCDIDVVLGNLNKLIPLEEGHDKLFVHGHMTLFKNTPDINRMFMSDIHSNETFQDVLADTENHIFDEPSDGLNINLISEQCGIKTFFDYKVADINPYSYLFKRSLYDYSCPRKQGRIVKQENIAKQIFYWERGNLFRYALNSSNEMEVDEFRYFHFQKRNMKIGDIETCDSFLIIPNTVIPFEEGIIGDTIQGYTKDKLIYPQYYYLKWKNLKKKVGGRIHVSSRG